MTRSKFFVANTMWGLFFLTVLATSVWGGEKVQSFQPKQEDTLPAHIFIPPGFDDNDNAQIVVDGELENTCYKVGPTTSRVDTEKKTVVVRQTMYHYTDPGCFCLEVREPYTVTVNLGVLPAGQYKVLVEKGGEQIAKGHLPVAIAKSPNADDYLYAPVSNVYVDPGNELNPSSTSNSETQIVLSGIFKNTCMEIQEVRANLRAGNIIEVLPIAQLREDRVCAQTIKRFEHRIAVSKLLGSGSSVAHGRYLIHVRSLNGQAVNVVGEF